MTVPLTRTLALPDPVHIIIFPLRAQLLFRGTPPDRRRKTVPNEGRINDKSITMCTQQITSYIYMANGRAPIQAKSFARHQISIRMLITARPCLSPFPDQENRDTHSGSEPGTVSHSDTVSYSRRPVFQSTQPWSGNSGSGGKHETQFGCANTP